MNRRMWCGGKMIVVGVLVAGATMLGAAPVPAQVDPPVVSVGDHLPGSRNTTTDCDGNVTEHPGSWLVRLERAGATDTALEVGLTVSGSLAGATQVQDDPAVIEVGATFAVVLLGVGGTEAGAVTLTVDAGTGYTVGTPPSITFDLPAAEEGFDCRAELPLLTGDAEQTIRVGERPAPVQLAAGPNHTVLGSLPPGIGIEPGPTLWTGAATTPGTYRFAIRQCLVPGTDGCLGQTSFVITVLAAAGPGSPGGTAPPATPLRARAGFTG